MHLRPKYNTRSTLTSQVQPAQNIAQRTDQQSDFLDSVLETLDEAHALAFLETASGLKEKHYKLRACLSHRLCQHQTCLQYVRACFKLNIFSRQPIEIFLAHKDQHQAEDLLVRKSILKFIQQHQEVEFRPFVERLALLGPSYRLYKSLSEQIQAHGGSLSKMIVLETDFDSRKVVARRDIQVHEQIMFVPKQMLITLELCRSVRLVQALLENGMPFKSPKHNQLAIFMLQQQSLGESSHFYHYLSVLPKDLKHFPVYFSEQLLIEMQGSAFLDVIRRKKDDMRQDYDAIVRFDPSFLKFSYEMYVNARLWVSSRVFGICIEQTKTDAMVPFADMLNHHLPKQTSWFYCNESQGFVVKSLRNIALGSQIFDSYGQKCNSRFLLNYGFTLESNSSNEVAVEINMHSLRGSFNIKLRILKSLQSKSFGELISTFRSIAQENQRQQNTQSSQSQRADEPEIELTVDLIKQKAFTSIENELKAWQLLGDFMGQQLRNYRTTLRQDKRLLQSDPALQTNLRNIVILRAGEKQILQFYKKMSRKMPNYLTGRGRNNSQDIELYDSYLSSLRRQNI